MSRDSDANDIRIELLSILEEARSDLHSWRFLSALKTASQDDRDTAAQAMLDVAVARQTLSAAILADIVEELEQEEAPLKLATAGLAKAAKRLDQIKPVLDAIGSIVGIVGRIVSLA